MREIEDPESGENAGWSSAEKMTSTPAEGEVGAGEVNISSYPHTGETWITAETGEPIEIVEGPEGVADSGYARVKEINTGEEYRVQPGHFGPGEMYERPDTQPDRS